MISMSTMSINLQMPVATHASRPCWFGNEWGKSLSWQQRAFCSLFGMHRAKQARILLLVLSAAFVVITTGANAQSDDTTIVDPAHDLLEQMLGDDVETGSSCYEWDCFSKGMRNQILMKLLRDAHTCGHDTKRAFLGQLSWSLYNLPAYERRGGLFDEASAPEPGSEECEEVSRKFLEYRWPEIHDPDLSITPWLVGPCMQLWAVRCVEESDRKESLSRLLPPGFGENARDPGDELGESDSWMLTLLMVQCRSDIWVEDDSRKEEQCDAYLEDVLSLIPE